MAEKEEEKGSKAEEEEEAKAAEKAEAKVEEKAEAEAEKPKTEEAEEVKAESKEEPTVDAKEEVKAEGEEENFEEEEEVKDEKDEEEEEEEEKETKPPPPKELEEDAPEDSRERLTPAIQLSDYDCTLDTYLSGQGVFGGTVVSSLSSGGFQYLLSGTRATAGVKSGRYYYEVRVLEKRGGEHFENALRVGFSLAGSSVFLGDGCDSVSFDQDGAFIAPAPDAARKPPQRVCRQPFKFQVVGVVLNLDPDSPNANTASLFLDGVRACQPQKIPKHLLGKALFPTVTFKNMTLAVNLGADGVPPLKSLPFKCRMFGDLSTADAETSSRTRPSAGTKYNVVVPVGLPSEGFFDFVDKFLERNPEYEELSDRKIMDWCRKSGLKSHNGYTKWGAKREWQGSRDRPVFRFGIQGIDNRGVKNMLKTVSQLAKRHYIVAEAKSNLVRKEREKIAQRFAAPHFDVVASVAIGEPAGEHKEWVHQKIRAEHEKKKAEAELKRKLQQERVAEKAERRAKFLEKRKKVLALKLKKKGKQGKDKAADDDGAEKEKEDAKDDKDEKDEAKKDEKDEAKEEDMEGSDEPAAKKRKLVDEEEEGDKAPVLPEPEVGPDVWYVPQAKDVPDVTQQVIASSYADFSFPSAEEGFSRIDFEWQPQAAAEEYLSKWIAEKKATMIIEDLKPSEWFAEKLKAWEESKKEWKQKQQERKEKQKAESKGSEKSGEQSEEQRFPEDLPELSEFESMDASENQAPIYAGFQHEDWLLFYTRYELHLLAHAFLADVKDSEYIGIPTLHFLHYYKLYFKRAFYYRNFGCDDLEGVVELVKDTLKIEEKGKSSYLTSLSSKEEDFIKFAKQVEEDRRDRIRRVEAGDESARLKFPKAGSKCAGRTSDGGGAGGKSAGKSGKSKAKGKGRAVRSWDGGEASEQSGSTQPKSWIRVMKPLRAGGSKGKGKGRSSSGAGKPWATGASSGGASAAAAAPVRSTWGRTQRPGVTSARFQQRREPQQQYYQASGGYRQQNQAWERKRPYPGADSPWNSQGKTMRPPPAPPAARNTSRGEKGGDKGKSGKGGGGKGAGQRPTGESRFGPSGSAGKGSSSGADRQGGEGAGQRTTGTSRFAPSTSVGKGAGEVGRRQGAPQRPSSQGSSFRPSTSATPQSRSQSGGSSSGGRMALPAPPAAPRGGSRPAGGPSSRDGGGASSSSARPSGGKGVPRGGDRDRDGRGPRPGGPKDGGREAPSRGFGSSGERRDEGRNREPPSRAGGRDRDQRGAPSSSRGGKGGREGDRDRRPRW